MKVGAKTCSLAKLRLLSLEVIDAHVYGERCESPFLF